MWIKAFRENIGLFKDQLDKLFTYSKFKISDE
jgi:hypothetical protein